MQEGPVAARCLCRVCVRSQDEEESVVLAADEFVVPTLEVWECTCFVWFKSETNWRSISNERLPRILTCVFRSEQESFDFKRKKISKAVFYIWWINSSLLRTEMGKQNVLQSKIDCLIYSLCSDRKKNIFFFFRSEFQIACLLVKEF